MAQRNFLFVSRSGLIVVDDIGERWFEDHDRLHTWGYLRES
jgi:hypothetical protein